MITFKRAEETDIPILRRLAGDIWRACYPSIITPEQIEYMLAWMYSEQTIREELAGGVVWELALRDGEPVGFLSFRFEPEDRKIKLNKLYLVPELHGRGLGQQMLSYAKAQAATLGAKQVYLTVNKGNTQAIRAYKRAGFRTAAAVVNDIGGGFVMDDYIMAFDLTVTAEEPRCVAGCD
jgi:RimJ/RimL family protein N-acetyltransferase